MWPIELTYKDSDTEETLDIYFYRPIGYLLARAASLIGATPNSVTITSLFAGLIGGLLFYYPSLMYTVIGMIFFVLYESLDSADGQLARMSGIHSRFGRILDGVVGDIVFINLYIALSFRFIIGGGTFWIIPLAFAAGLSNSLQTSMADYYRNCYIYFVRGAKFSEHDLSASILAKYQALSFWKSPLKKILNGIYLTYTYQQETLARSFLKLRGLANSLYGDDFPSELKSRYQELNKPMIKYYNILTVNTRIIALFIFLLLEMPYMYFLFEIVILNLLFAYVLLRQNQIFAIIRVSFESKAGADV